MLPEGNRYIIYFLMGHGFLIAMLVITGRPHTPSTSAGKRSTATKRHNENQWISMARPKSNAVFLSPCFSFHVAIVWGVYGASVNLISEEFSTTLGGWPTLVVSTLPIVWKMMEWKSMVGGWHPINMKWKIKHVWNHQPVYNGTKSYRSQPLSLYVWPSKIHDQVPPWDFSEGHLANDERNNTTYPLVIQDSYGTSVINGGYSWENHL